MLGWGCRWFHSTTWPRPSIRRVTCTLPASQPRTPGLDASRDLRHTTPACGISSRLREKLRRLIVHVFAKVYLESYGQHSPYFCLARRTHDIGCCLKRETAFRMSRDLPVNQHQAAVLVGSSLRPSIRYSLPRAFGRMNNIAYTSSVTLHVRRGKGEIRLEELLHRRKHTLEQNPWILLAVAYTDDAAA